VWWGGNAHAHADTNGSSHAHANSHAHAHAHTHAHVDTHAHANTHTHAYFWDICATASVLVLWRCVDWRRASP